MSTRFLMALGSFALGTALLMSSPAHAQATDPAPVSAAPTASTPAPQPQGDQGGRGWHHRQGQERFAQGGPHHRLSPEERQARLARFDAHFFKAHGGTANGVTREDWMKHAARQFDRLDINHDGVISPYELNIAAKHWRHRHRQAWRHHHHGQGFRHHGQGEPRPASTP